MGKVIILALSANRENEIFEKIMDVLSDEQVFRQFYIMDETELKFGSLAISASRRMVYLDGKEVSLTTREFDILYFMASHPGQVFTMKQLYESTTHEPYYDTFQTVSSIIYRIRKKIGTGLIVNVHGYGYKFNWNNNYPRNA